MDEKKGYTIKTALFFFATVVLVGFSIVTMVQGIMEQYRGIFIPAFIFYVVTVTFIVGSFLSYKKANHMLNVLNTSRI